MSEPSTSTATQATLDDQKGEREQLLRLGEHLATLAQELSLPELGEEIRQETRRRLLDVRLQVFVLGEINHGKSSMLNALIGEEALPTGVRPTTAKLVRIRGGEVPGSYAQDSMGRRRRLDAEAFSEHVKGLHEESDPLLELICPAGLVPAGLELIDTPGLNDIESLRSAVGSANFGRADLLVVVLDATAPLRQTEGAALKDAIASLGGTAETGAATGAAIEVVLTRSDLLDDAARRDVREYVQQRLSEMGIEARAPILIDARPPKKRQTPGDDPGVTELRNRLRGLSSVAAPTATLRARSILEQRARLIRYNLDVQLRALEQPPEAIQEALTKLRELQTDPPSGEALSRSIVEGVELLIAASKERVGEFASELESEVLERVKSASVEELSNVVPRLLRDGFTEFATQEAAQVRGDLDDLCVQLLNAHTETVRRVIARASLAIRFAGPQLQLEAPPLAIEAGLVAVGIAGTVLYYFGNFVSGLLMAIAGPLTTVVLRERSVRVGRARAKELLPSAIKEAADELNAQIEIAVNGCQAGLAEHIQLAREALTKQLIADLEAAGQAKEPAARDSRAELLRGLDQRLEAMIERLVGATPS